MKLFIYLLAGLLLTVGSAPAHANKIEKWAIANDLTGEVKEARNMRGGAPVVKPGERAVKLPPQFDGDDLEHLKLSIDKTTVIKKPVSDLLVLAKRDRLKKLEQAKDHYVLSHYSILALIGFNDTYTESVEIEKNTAETAAHKTKAASSKTRLKQFRTWYKQVAGYYYGKAVAINSALDQSALSAVTWDFTTLNASDPKVTLSEVMIL